METRMIAIDELSTYEDLMMKDMRLQKIYFSFKAHKIDILFCNIEDFISQINFFIGDLSDIMAQPGWKPTTLMNKLKTSHIYIANKADSLDWFFLCYFMWEHLQPEAAQKSNQATTLLNNIICNEFIRGLEIYNLKFVKVSPAYRGNTETFIESPLGYRWFAVPAHNSSDYDEVQFKVFPPNAMIRRPEPLTTKTDEIKAALLAHGFFDLSMVSKLSTDGQEKLFRLIAENKNPYRIAMFDHLGYLKYLEKEYFKSQKEMTNKMSTWLTANADGRGIKGLINSLNENSNEDRDRYDALKHKEKVISDYKSIK